MPGTNADMYSATNCAINLLDSGSSTSFGQVEKQNRNYGKPIASARWSQIFVEIPEFTAAKPTAGMQTGPTNMIIFGG